MTRLDWLLLCLGPFSILLIWALLPGGAREGAPSAGGGVATGVVAELVGYAFAAELGSRPRLLGRGEEADVRLHSAPIAARAARVVPPRRGRPFWTASPARPELTLGPVPDGSGDRAGAATLRHGDLLAIGRTRFLVHAADPPGADGRESGLELLHVRHPRAPGYFRSGAGHEVYHPNARALWAVPPCAEEALLLTVRPRRGAAGSVPATAELPLRDRLQRRRIAAAARHDGVPRELPAVEGDRVRERSVLSLCTVRGREDEILLRLAADSPRRVRVRTSEDGDGTRLGSGEATVPLGSERHPAEALVTLDGNLVRIAPAAGRRVTRRTRLGLAGYLIFVLLLQALPLTVARHARRRALRRRAPWAADAAWPAELGTPTLQQLAGSGIAVLLFSGASFQLLLGLQPQLAGKPDYAQAFLQGVVAVCTVLTAAAAFTAGGRLPQRSAFACLGAALALAGAAGWWWWDGRGVADALWLSALRNQAVAAAGASPDAAGRLFERGAAAALLAALAWFASAGLRWPRAIERGARLALGAPFLAVVLLAAGGLGLGVLQRSALAFELAVLGGLAWFAAVYWAFVRRARLPGQERSRRRAAVLSLASGLVMLLFLILFFVVGADLPGLVSFACVAVGAVIVGAAVAIMVAEKFSSLLRVLALWLVAALFGCAFASLALADMGSIAAWIPAALTGLFLWLVRPEEQEGRAEEPRKAWTHLLLALGLGLVLLGALDVVQALVEGPEWPVLARPRQRFDLADDVSYITAGEWITQVRWLASRQDAAFRWVPNVNSDVAVFGLAAAFGSWLAVAASLMVLAVAGCAALAADQALREGRAAAYSAEGDRLYPTLYRALGLFSGMVCVLLTAQWLVHLATGVALHLPVTGLVFPWISHGNTTHVLYAAAVVLPMAAITALGGRAEGS